MIAIGGFGLSGTVAEVLNPAIVPRRVAKPERMLEIAAIKQSFLCAYMVEQVVLRLDLNLL